MDRKIKHNSLRWMLIGIFMIAVSLFAIPATAEAASTFTSKAVSIKKTSEYHNGKAVVKWYKYSGATSYEVYRSTKKDSGYKKWGSTKALSFKKATSGIYYYKVRAVKGKQKSKFSKPVRIVSVVAKLDTIGYISGTYGTGVRFHITNKTGQTMTMKSGDYGYIYLVDKKTKKVVRSSSAWLNMESGGVAKAIYKNQTKNVYYFCSDSHIMTLYNKNKTKYTVLASLPFYPGSSSYSYGLACTGLYSDCAIVGRVF